MKKRGLILAVTGIISLFLFWSCEGYMDQFNMEKLSLEMELSPAFAAPIGYGEFSIDDILSRVLDSSNIIQLEDDSTMYVYYETSIDPINVGDQLPSIPDNSGSIIIQKSDLDFDVPGGIDLVPPDVELEFKRNETMVFQLNPEDRIDSVYLSEGTLSIELYSQFQHPGELSISTKGLIDTGGDSLYVVLPIDNADGTFRQTTNIDLSGYKFIMDRDGETTTITLNFSLKMTTTSAGFSSDEVAGMNVDFTGISFNVLFGRIAPQAIDVPSQSIPLDVFNSVNVESLPSFFFADPQINMIFHNSVGVPLTFNLDLASRSAIDGTEYTLDLIDDFKPFIVQAPTVDQLGETVTSELNLNVETSNIDEFLSNIPNLISFGANVEIGNPEGYTEQNFITDTSGIAVEIDLKLPFHFKTSGYTLKDTLDIDLEELLSNITQVDSLVFGMRTTNEWPFELGIQLKYLDANYNVLGNLFESYTPLLEAAPVTSEGDLDESNLEEYAVEIRLLEDDFNALQGAKYLMFEAKIVTTDDGATPVKLKSNYKLKYEFYIAAGVTVRTSDFIGK